jgi:FtsP/CotA-like multicopper oxidase with cupredoxin domain
MSTQSNKHHTPTKSVFSRRDFLKFAGGAALAAAGASVLPGALGKLLQPDQVATAAGGAPDLYYAGTDGWISLPANPPIGYYHPDSLAPAPFTTYIFGFRNITGLSSAQITNQKMKAQHNAPFFWVNEFTGGNEFRMQLTNLGLQMRPDLTDAHTLHWHGFRNVIPFFDGEPTGSVSVPVNQNLTYVYRPRDPGTYMFHCHVEDVEHVHMGMTGLVFVRPAQNVTNPSLYQSGKYAYNDGNGSTGYDREFGMFLSEVWAEAHWDDAHIQLPDWTDYKADFALLNGRVFPDTLAPNGSIDPFNPLRDVNGDLIPTPGYEHLQYQPHSALVKCNSGDRVLLRFANLGFKEAAMTMTGIKMRIVGRDATFMRGRDGTDTSHFTDVIDIGAGESYDVIFNAPAYQGPGPYDTYLLYNRNLIRSNNLAAGGFGGQMTEVRVYPSGALAPQSTPNT